MSILIKGMEMPTNCADCPLGGSLCCYLLPCVPALWAEYTNAVREKRRHSDCPLVPVPKHGRLIDADAMKEAFSKVWKDNQFYSTITAEVVDNTPAIIPAEEDEE